jgi:hypothetical protein
MHLPRWARIGLAIVSAGAFVVLGPLALSLSIPWLILICALMGVSSSLITSVVLDETPTWKQLLISAALGLLLGCFGINLAGVLRTLSAPMAAEFSQAAVEMVSMGSGAALALESKREQEDVLGLQIEVLPRGLRVHEFREQRGGPLVDPLPEGLKASLRHLAKYVHLLPPGEVFGETPEAPTPTQGIASIVAGAAP